MENSWKTIPIKGYEGYKVSNTGKVRSDIIRSRWGGFRKRKHPLELKQDITHDGYCRVTLNAGNISKHFAVHRLVALAFIPNPSNLPEINHKDEDTRNNHVDNLEWCSRKYNANFGTLPQREKSWSTNHPSKSKPVIQLSVNGDFIAEFPSINEAVRQTSVSERGIGRCCMGKAATSGGYKWKYKV